jgi:penicillin-binding protein 2
VSNGTPRLRLTIVGIVAVALFASLFARLYDLQIVGSPEFQVQADANRIRTVTVEAPRGRILDRTGKVLVDNRVTIVVAVDRNAFDELDRSEQDEMLVRLSAELTAVGQVITPGQIRDRIKDSRYSRYAPVPIAHEVTDQLKIYIEEQPDLFPAVVAERAPIREYPYGRLAAHIFGYVGQINQDELTYVRASGGDKPYALNDEIGKSGVERTFENYLRGTPGLRRIEVDANGDPVRVINERQPVQGDDLVLAIDIDIQALAQQKVEQGLADARARPTREGNEPNNGITGAAVVQDPRNGEVLALASYPTVDPTQFVDGIDANEWAYLNDPANHYPLNNYAIQGQWAPGSTYKLFVGYASATSGLRPQDEIYRDQGGYSIPGCTGEKCTRRNAGGTAYGNVNLSSALTVSSDSYFYSVGAEFWLQRDRLGGDAAMQQYLSPWGIGEETGIALTGESAGRIPDPAWKVRYCERLRENNPDASCDDVWRTGDSVNMAIGQGDVLVTPLQLGNGYATFANGGTRYVPQIALRAQSSATGEVTEEFGSAVAGTVSISPEIRQAEMDGLLGVPRPGGTAARAFAGFDLDAFPVAGKTGTAQVLGKADTAVFSAFGPAPAPRFQVTVVLEESGFGGTASAPVARALFDVLSGAVPEPTVAAGGVLPPPTALTAGAGVD